MSKVKRIAALLLPLLLPALAAAGIVVLGAAQYNGEPSPIFRARLLLAKRLWEAGLAEKILVTGGRGENARYAEGEVGCNYLARLGVPKSALLCETESKSTWENLKAAKEVFKDAEVIIVTDAPHLPRALLYAKKLGLRAKGFAVEGEFSPEYRYRERLYYYLSLPLPAQGLDSLSRLSR